MLYRVVAALLPRSGIVAAMARPLDASTGETSAYHGEVWTAARGYATVTLPAETGPLEPPSSTSYKTPSRGALRP